MAPTRRPPCSVAVFPAGRGRGEGGGLASDAYRGPSRGVPCRFSSPGTGGICLSRELPPAFASKKAQSRRGLCVKAGEPRARSIDPNGALWTRPILALHAPDGAVFFAGRRPPARRLARAGIAFLCRRTRLASPRTQRQRSGRGRSSHPRPRTEPRNPRSSVRCTSKGWSVTS